MARKLRVEFEGGLYHVITRGNDRRDVFHSPDDHLKFLSLLAKQKDRSPFYLYAYCQMTNHVHLLIERQADTVGSIMQRVLTSYSQYYNRRVVVRSDLFTKGDGKKIAVQHYDQLGRGRLSRSIENPWEDPYNETHGIKVETLYQTGNPNSY